MTGKTKTYVKASKILALAFSIFTLNACNNSLSMPKTNVIESIKLNVHIEMVDQEQWQLHQFEDSFTVYRHKDMILYRTNVGIMDVAKTNEISGKNTFLLEPTGKVYHEYYVHKTNSNVGLMFDSSLKRKGTKFFVDSLKNKYSMLDYKIDLNENDILISTEELQGKGKTLKYILKKKIDDSYPDSTILFFSNQMTNLNHTFSSKLDSVNKMKLFKVICIWKEIPKGQYPTKIPSRKLIFEMKKDTNYNDQEILNIFNHVEQKIDGL